MKLIGCILLSALFCLLTMQTAQAGYCPKNIGGFAHKGVYADIEQILQKTYQELGCDTVFTNYPSKRSLALFNNEKIDGELFRLTMIERAYQKAFIKSDALFEMNLGVFQAGPQKKQPVYDIGYVLGVKWNEEYLKQNFSKYKSTRRYTTVPEMLGALVRGQIRYALSEERTVRWFYEQHEYLSEAIMVEQFNSFPVFHYLDAQYAEFMTDFNKYIRTVNPFSEMKN